MTFKEFLMENEERKRTKKTLDRLKKTGKTKTKEERYKDRVKKANG